MKNILKILFIVIPFFGFGQVQTCITLNNVTNADSVVYCVTNTTCYDTCNGVLSITVWGQSQNQPYSFEWFNNSTPWVGISAQDTLCPGDYIVTITDVNGNLVNNSHINTIEGPPNFSVFEESLISPSCFNYNDGFIDLTIAGATPFDPDGIANSGDEYYTYLWEDGTSTEDRTSLDSGIYIISITDANGCNRVDSFELFNPFKVNSQTITDTLSCIGACDGTGIVIPSDGIAPYYYLWDDPLAQTTSSADSLCYGLATVFITDSMGCLDTNTVFIENPDTLKLSNITIDNACYQVCDGQLSVTIEGGQPPYNKEWSLGGNILPYNDTITEDTLCPGNYQLIYTDANNCSDTVIIPLIERDSFVVADWIIDDSCYNSCTGQITVQLMNQDNPPFTYAWDNGGTDTVISNLCSDSFELILIDDRLCKDTFEFFIDEPDSLSYDTIEVTHNLCYGDTIGAITIGNLTGGVVPITYSWSNGTSGPIPGISSLPADMYSVHIEDANECAINVANIEVTEPDSLYVFYTPSAVSCFGYSDGSISVNLSGGTVPYKLNNILLSANDTIISNLAAGQYLYTILDSNNCIRPEDTITVNEPDILEIDTVFTHVLCHGDSTGSIDLTVIGGNPAYSYVWSNSDTTADLVNIVAGTYNVLVTDIKGCTENGIYMITEPLSPIISTIDGTDILCHGDNTGSADLTVAGGTPPYSYQWSNADTTKDIDNLIEGTYIVTIIDANGCLYFDTIIIIEPDELLATSTTTDITCYGFDDGTATLTLSGGTGILTVDWFGINPSALSPGTHNYTITDINGCIFTDDVTIIEPDELLATSATTNITCYGFDNGTSTLTLSGGTGTLTVDWFGMNPFALSPGTHNYSVIDFNGCTFTDNVTIIEPDELLATSTITHVTCNGGNDGTAILTLSGGTGTLIVDWFGINTASLSQGTYNYSVTDFNGCLFTDDVTINEPLAYLTYYDVNHVMCFGDLTGSINFSVISGNTQPYTYIWSNGAISEDISLLSAGTYTVFISDANGCPPISVDITLTQPEDLIFSYSVYHATCEENDDGSITTNVAGGTEPYDYSWSNGLYDQDLYNLAKGSYTVTINDANSCDYPTQTIEVGFEGYDGCIEIPSGFTPNNDGTHDEWAIYGLYNFPDVVVNIYNRWGQRIFFSEGYTVPWDGKNGGVDLPIATYYYVIELKDSGKVFNGTVTIKR